MGFKAFLLAEFWPEISFVEASWKRQKESRSVRSTGLDAKSATSGQARKPAEPGAPTARGLTGGSGSGPLVISRLNKIFELTALVQSLSPTAIQSNSACGKPAQRLRNVNQRRNEFACSGVATAGRHLS